MATKCFDVANKRVDVAMASAAKQDELLSLLAQRLIISSGIAKQGGITLNEDSCLIMCMTLPQDVKSRVSSILTEMAFEVGTGTPVTVADFEGKIVEWNRFLARLIMWNLGDFFELLASASLESAVRAKNAEAK